MVVKRCWRAPSSPWLEVPTALPGASHRDAVSPCLLGGRRKGLSAARGRLPGGLVTLDPTNFGTPSTAADAA